MVTSAPPSPFLYGVGELVAVDPQCRPGRHNSEDGQAYIVKGTRRRIATTFNTHLSPDESREMSTRSVCIQRHSRRPGAAVSASRQPSQAFKRLIVSTMLGEALVARNYGNGERHPIVAFLRKSARQNMPVACHQFKIEFASSRRHESQQAGNHNHSID